MKSLDTIWLEKIAASAPKARPQANEVTSSMKPTLVVTFNENDEQIKTFIRSLDKVLSSLSNIKNLQIKAFHSMKDSSAIGQLKAPVSGLALYRGKELIGALGYKSTEQDIRKFFDSNRKALS